MSNYSATYSPEDNKLRLYAVSRLPKDLYLRVKAAGFRWAPKQELFVAPGWTPAREDLLLELCDEIDDEDYSPEERAADRAERFSDYRDKRRDEAGGFADRFESGPQVFGHQSQARAERQATRHDRIRGHATSQWSKAEYWQTRTAGVIRHALHKSSAPVRRSRILRLEAEQRKHEQSRADYARRFKTWTAVSQMDGANVPSALDDNSTPAFRAAYALANMGGCWGEYKHPRTGQERSLYSHLTDPQGPITPAEAAALWLQYCSDPSDPDSNSARWSSHYELRLGYERAMLAEEGGSAAEAEMEAGGWIGKRQIHAINRSPVTKRVVSVKIMAPSGWHEDGPDKLRSFNIERLPEGAYRAPTDAEREQFKVATKQRKAEAKATAPKALALINPTEADAERLQGLLNDIGKASHDKAVKEHRAYGEYIPTPVMRMTQAQYSAASKGSYTSFETRTLHNAGGLIARRSSNMYTSEGSEYDKQLGPATCKIRTRYSSGSWHTPPHVVVITDKPQKALPQVKAASPAPVAVEKQLELVS